MLLSKLNKTISSKTHNNSIILYTTIPVTYFHILSTPSWDALTINWCLCGTIARSVTKSTWEWLWAESVYVSVPLGAKVDDEDEAAEELDDWGVGVHISLNTSTPSMIFDLKSEKKVQMRGRHKRFSYYTCKYRGRSRGGSVGSDEPPWRLRPHIQIMCLSGLL